MGLDDRTLAESGELEFIRAIRDMMPLPDDRIVRATGEDCLVTRVTGPGLMLHTVDTFVDGIHFNPEWTDWESIGGRIMSAAVSDIAAMAGTPIFSMVSMSMPGTAILDDMVALFRGMQDCANSYGCPISGGETTSTPGPVTVAITVAGKTTADTALTRAGACPGDRIFVTGTLGDAMAGLMSFQRAIPGFEELRDAFAAPRARVREAIALTASHSIRAMIDISDGLATDLSHLCGESNVGADVFTDHIPVSKEFLRFAGHEQLDPVSFALSSGEEFELLFTSSDPELPEQSFIEGTPVTCIGKITEPGQGIILCGPDGDRESLTIKGYEHFRL